MEKLKEVGSVMVILGVASYLLSLVGLQFKALSFLGGYKVYVEIASIVLGVLFIVVAKLTSKKEDATVEDNADNVN